MADMLGTGMSSLRALQRALDTTVPQHRKRFDGGLHPPARGLCHAQTAGLWVQLDRQRRRCRRRCSASTTSFSPGGPQLQRHAFAPGYLRHAGGAGRQPARRQRQRSECLAAELHQCDQRSFQHAELDFGAPGAAGPGQRAGAAPAGLRPAPARNVRGSRHAPGWRSGRDHDAGAGRRAAQRRDQLGDSADRPAAQRPARPARPAHRPAVVEGRRHGGCRRRLDAERLHRHRPAAGARHHRLADHHRQGSARSGAHAAGLEDAVGHHRHFAQRVGRRARRPAGLAQPDARSGAQRTGPHHAGRCFAGQRAASRGHGSHRRAGRRFLQRRRRGRDGRHHQYLGRHGDRDAHQSRRHHHQRLRC